MEFADRIAAVMPRSPSDGIAWDRVEPLFSGICFDEMKTTPQNPLYHGEGDVYRHTRLVCRELTGTAEFHALPERQRTELFLSALLHDVGKVKTTRMENGAWTSPNHAAQGSRTVRSFLWGQCGLCGDREAIVFRETVCALVRHHMLPMNLTEREDPVRAARETAALGETAPDFTWRLLCMLAEADVKGRIADDVGDCLLRVRLAGIAAEEARCPDGPYPFPDGATRRAWLSGRNVPPDIALYDGAWGEVVMMSGLPGTGKDTWIRENCPELPMVSLDDIRGDMGVAPTDSQGEVVVAARERAKEYLRRKQPFVWNATNLTRETRRKLCGLFERYGAAVRIVYLETAPDRRARRNLGRARAVPESAVAKMLERTVPPSPDEARTVEWICV